MTTEAKRKHFLPCEPDDMAFVVNPNGGVRYHSLPTGDVPFNQAAGLYRVAKLIVLVLFDLNLDELLPPAQRDKPWIS